MKIEFSITLPTEVSSLILKALSKYDDIGNSEPVSTVAEAPAKPSKPAATAAKAPAAPKAGASKKPGKAKAPEPEPIEEEIETPAEEPEEELEQGSDDDFAEPSEDEDELVSPDEQKELKAALRAHSEKHKSREGAAKILMKYAKTSDQVKRKDLPALFKALGWKP